jgi:hypothetical protein
MTIFQLGAMVRKRKIIVSIATSADGFIARRDGSVDWLDRPRPKGNGIALFVTARRKDELNPRYEVE